MIDLLVIGVSAEDAALVLHATPSDETGKLIQTIALESWNRLQRFNWDAVEAEAERREPGGAPRVNDWRAEQTARIERDGLHESTRDFLRTAAKVKRDHAEMSLQQAVELERLAEQLPATSPKSFE